jgi:hypothetical protein
MVAHSSRKNRSCGLGGDKLCFHDQANVTCGIEIVGASPSVPPCD